MIRTKTIMIATALLAAFCFGEAPKTCHSQSVQSEYNTASGYYSRQQWEESSEAFKSVIARYPNTDEAAASHFFLGEAMMQMGDFAGAYQAFQGFLTKLPNHRHAPRALFRLG